MIGASSQVDSTVARRRGIALALSAAALAWVLLGGGQASAASLCFRQLPGNGQADNGQLAGTGQALREPRSGAVAATLPDGEVLIAGGTYCTTSFNGPVKPFASSAELFNPITDTFTKLAGPGQSLIEPREGALVAMLPDRQLLIAGGRGKASEDLSRAELFNPATDTFTKLTGAEQSLTEGRYGAVAATLPDGQVLIAGGQTFVAGERETQASSSAELFNPATNTFTKLMGAERSLTEARSGAVAATLPDGQVLIAGGAGNPPPVGGGAGPGCCNADSSAQLFNPRTDKAHR